MRSFFLGLSLLLTIALPTQTQAATSVQDENDSAAWNKKGEEYVKAGKYDEAVGAFKQAVKLQSEFFDAQMNLGAAYQHLGRIDEAIEGYKAASKLRPESEFPYWFLGNAYAS